MSLTNVEKKFKGVKGRRKETTDGAIHSLWSDSGYRICWLIPCQMWQKSQGWHQSFYLEQLQEWGCHLQKWGRLGSIEFLAWLSSFRKKLWRSEEKKFDLIIGFFIFSIVSESLICIWGQFYHSFREVAGILFHGTNLGILTHACTDQCGQRLFVGRFCPSCSPHFRCYVGFLGPHN